MGFFDALPSLNDAQQIRRAKPKGADPSRLQRKVADATDERKAEARWKKAVWTRDVSTCRWCRRRVERRIDLDPRRGEVHHVSGRVVRAIRWDRRNGLLVCAACHERLTGTVGEKHVLESKHTFTVNGVSYLNADKPLRFRRVA